MKPNTQETKGDSHSGRTHHRRHPHEESPALAITLVFGLMCGYLVINHHVRIMSRHLLSVQGVCTWSRVHGIVKARTAARLR